MIKYFIGQATNWETQKVYMEQALGHLNVTPRFSLDNTLVLFKFNTDNLPEGFSEEDGYTKEEILTELQGPNWTPEE